VRIGFDGRKLRDFGIGTYIQGLLGGFQQSASPRHYVVFLPDDAARAELPLAHDPRFTLAVDRSPRYSLRELWAMPRQMRRYNVDLFHAPHYVLPPLRPCPAVVTIHDLIHLRFPAQLPARPAWVYAQVMLRWAARSARRVITVSEATRRDLVDLLGVPEKKIRVIPNGVSPLFRPVEDERTVAQAVGALGVARPYLLFVGNPKPHKNLSFLLDVFARLAPKIPSLRLVIVGAATPEIRTRLEGDLAAAGLTDRVRLLGYLSPDRLVVLYQGALGLVIPSRYEGFGLPALEAMACGTPVVAASAGALPEVVGEAGWLLSPDDPEAWVAALGELCTGPALREKLRNAGTARAAAFTWQTAAAATEAVYDEVGGRRPGV
jgi:glycosyltransferase involved in cell wall biosynthesis